MATTRQNHANLLDRKSIRNALRSWSNAQELGEHPLTGLAVVEARRRAAGYADTLTGRGVALRNVLRDAIEMLRPDDGPPDFLEKRWRPYIIIGEQYLDGRNPDYLAEQLGIARSTYNHEQAAALDSLADILSQWEQSRGILRPGMTSVIPRVQSFRGREEELRYYLRQLEEEHVAIITGMPGIGKTALGAEMATQYQEWSDVFWMTFGEGINTDIDSVFREIGVYLYELGQEEFWNFLQLEGEADRRYPVHTKIQRLIQSLEGGEHTLCFDDYQLVNRDRDLTTLFEVLRERATHGRTMYLLVMGQEKPAFAADVELRPLAGLSRRDAQGLLADAGLRSLQANMFERLYRVTGGHPVFLQLFSAWVVNSGLAGFETGEVTAQVEQFIEGMTQSAEIETYLLVSVYNALSPQEQHLAELMSAFRLPFDDRDEAVIEMFVGGGIENPGLVLASLVRKHIVRRVGGTGYIDYHPLLRQYFYNRLRGQLALKRRLHGRIGEYYEHCKEDHLEAAYHYCEAGECLRMVQLLDGHHKQLIGAGKARRMLEILSPLRKHQVPPATWPVVAAIQGQGYAFLGEYDEALDRFEGALVGFESLSMTDEERRRAADLARQMGRLYGWRGEYEQANARMEQALEILGDVRNEADRATAALIHAHIGSLYYLQGRLDLAEEECRRALDFLGDWDSGPVGAQTYHVLGVVCQATGRWDQAFCHYHSSQAIWTQMGDRHHLAQVTDNLGKLHFYRGDFKRAERLFRENLDFWHEVGARDNASYARLNLGGIYLIRGRWEQAREYYTQALAAWQQTGHQKLIALAYSNLGFLELARGYYEEARKYLEQSVNEDPSGESYRGLGEAELGVGHLDQALEYASKSLALARESGMPFEEGLTLRTLGRIYQALGDLDQARQYLGQSLSILEGLGARYEVGLTQYDLGLLEADVGEAEVSQAYLDEAIAIFEGVGAKDDLQRSQQSSVLDHVVAVPVW
ncbi:MAG: tetratricopeptide repeat protein [Anaerolineae bacterium]